LYRPVLTGFRARQAQFTTVTPVSPVGDATALYGDMVERGLELVLKNIVNSSTPLYNKGAHVALGVSCQGRMHTVLDPTLWNVVDDSGKGVHFEATTVGGCATLPVGVEQVAYIRQPLLGESVSVLTVDKEGVCMSQLLSITWASVDGIRFRLSSVPKMAGVEFIGGVIVALSDGAALGLYAEQLRSETGVVAGCHNWQGLTIAAGAGTGLANEDLLRTLQVRFPSLLHVAAWSAQDAAAVSLREEQLASVYRRVGRSALVATVAAAALPLSGDVGGVSAVSVTEDDAWMLDKARAALGDLPGWGAFDSSLRSAMLLTFFGAVYMREGSEVFYKILDELGVFGDNRPLEYRAGERPVSSSF